MNSTTTTTTTGNLPVPQPRTLQSRQNSMPGEKGVHLVLDDVGTPCIVFITEKESLWYPALDATTGKPLDMSEYGIPAWHEGLANDPLSAFIARVRGHFALEHPRPNTYTAWHIERLDGSKRPLALTLDPNGPSATGRTGWVAYRRED